MRKKNIRGLKTKKRILKKLIEGKRASEIAREMGTTRQAINYLIHYHELPYFNHNRVAAKSDTVKEVYRAELRKIEAKIKKSLTKLK